MFSACRTDPTPDNIAEPEMMHMPRLMWTLPWILIAALLASCSKAPAPAAPSAPTATTSVDTLPTEGDNVLRAKLTAGGMRIEYAAQFDGDQLTRIVEHRHAEAAVLEGDYELKGARLLHYRGTKLADSTALDLTFDMQGVLQSGAGPHVSDEDIRAVQNRAQLLRSHALAQRASRMHQ